jgi:integrase
MSGPIEISNGRQAVKIYRTTVRGQPIHQMAYYRGGRRERRTFADLGKARREAKLILAQLASETAEAAEAVTTPEMESLVAARKALGGLGCPVHVAVETFAEAIRRLGTTDSPGTTLLEAVALWRKHHPAGFQRLPLQEMARRFVESRQSLGLSSVYVHSCDQALRNLLSHFKGDALELPSSEATVKWLESRYPHPRTRNSNLSVLKTFGRWAQKQRFVAEEPFSDLPPWKHRGGNVEILTPEEMRRLLEGLPKLMVPAVAIGGFAGLRVAEVRRLDWKEVNLERGFITVAAEKAKTAARRLVPIQPNLKAWLAPHARPEGEVMPFRPGYVQELVRKKGLPRKRNALRHSYISYRLAVTPDAPRVALEAGNSPEMIFRHYRELVTPEQGQEWFGIMSGAVQ